MNAMLESFHQPKSAKINKLKTLYRAIQKNGPIKAETLMLQTNTTHATCARLLDELQKNNLVSVKSSTVSTGGRKPNLYQITPDAAYLIGIEVTALYSTISLLDLHLSIKQQAKIKTAHFTSIYDTLDFIITETKKLVTTANLSFTSIIGTGLSIDDYFDSFDHKKNDLTTEIKTLEAYIEAQLPSKVTIGSGVNFAALAEYRLNYGASSRHFLFSTSDMELRSCTLTHGGTPLSSNGMSFTFGHTIIDSQGPVCSCGAKGCLRTFSSLPAIKAAIIQRVNAGETSQLSEVVSSIEEIDFFDILSASENGDTLCKNVLEEAAYYYGIALSNQIIVYQPDTVVCGGTLIPKSSFFEVVQRTIAERLAPFSGISTNVYPAKDSYDIVSQGAGGIVLEKLLRS
ncbi:ROK family protein [Brochothrix thermosphacta]|uniref:ROK family protein n=1 Tax=Brochothrix thermosphacta TaxID=2756 RepID=UPI000D795B69|nr:ROK family protein [Brochothrix thermosphacta]SPN76031.1 putative transcriptional regulator/sugar kinase [Brochothrix thermosphacta]